MSLNMGKQAVLEPLGSNEAKYRNARCHKVKSELLEQLLELCRHHAGMLRLIPLGECFGDCFFDVIRAFVFGSCESTDWREKSQKRENVGKTIQIGEGNAFLY